MWASVAVMLACAPITALVQHDLTGTWVTLVAATVVLIASTAERRRVQRQRRAD